MVAVPSTGRASEVTPRRAAPEADATRDLYERYARQIYVYCLHQLRSREEAEDAMQSTFLNAFRGLKRGVDPEFESAWLYKIAQNVCLTRQRSSTRRRRVESPGDLDAMQDTLPSHEVESDELIGLPQALEEMPEQQRRALLLREWQGLSYREIADEMGLSQGAVETLLFRARRTLAAGLTEQSPARRVAAKIRAGGDAGSVVALLKGFLTFGGAKVAATVATVAATSVVAATPAARDAVEHAVAHPVRHVAPRAHVVRRAAPAPVSPTVRAVAPATRRLVLATPTVPHRFRRVHAARAKALHRPIAAVAAPTAREVEAVDDQPEVQEPAAEAVSVPAAPEREHEKQAEPERTTAAAVTPPVKADHNDNARSHERTSKVVSPGPSSDAHRGEGSDRAKRVAPSVATPSEEAPAAPAAVDLTTPQPDAALADAAHGDHGHDRQPGHGGRSESADE